MKTKRRRIYVSPLAHQEILDQNEALKSDAASLAVQLHHLRTGYDKLEEEFKSKQAIWEVLLYDEQLKNRTHGDLREDARLREKEVIELRDIECRRRQTIQSLKSEIAELKQTINALENERSKSPSNRPNTTINLTRIFRGGHDEESKNWRTDFLPDNPNSPWWLLLLLIPATVLWFVLS